MSHLFYGNEAGTQKIVFNAFLLVFVSLSPLAFLAVLKYGLLDSNDQNQFLPRKKHFVGTKSDTFFVVGPFPSNPISRQRVFHVFSGREEQGWFMDLSRHFLSISPIKR